MAGRSLTDYLAQYDHEHTYPVNKLLHGFGVPAVVASLVVGFFDWRWGVGLFAGGWLLLFLGHKMEGNQPARPHLSAGGAALGGQGTLGILARAAARRRFCLLASRKFCQPAHGHNAQLRLFEPVV